MSNVFNLAPIKLSADDEASVEVAIECAIERCAEVVGKAACFAFFDGFRTVASEEDKKAA